MVTKSQLKPWYRLECPVKSFLADSFLLPANKDDDVNPYLNLKQDKRGKEFGFKTNNTWILFFDQIPIQEVLSVQAIDYFKSITDSDFKNIWIFRAEHKHPGNIHCDWAKHHTLVERDSNNYAINWTLGDSKNHSMIWYEPINPQIIDGWPVDAYSPHPDQPHVSPTWTKDYVREIDRCTITGPTLVRTNIPHNGEHYDVSAVRWAFSLRPKLHTASWEKTVEYFTDVIIE